MTYPQGMKYTYLHHNDCISSIYFAFLLILSIYIYFDFKLEFSELENPSDTAYVSFFCKGAIFHIFGRHIRSAILYF